MSRTPPEAARDEDLLREMAELALATRLRRLGERLMRGAAQLYRDLGLDFEPRWFALLHLLCERGPTSVTAASAALGLTHPAVVRLAREMTSNGLLSSSRPRRDRRQRLLRATAKGRVLRQRIAPMLEELTLVMREIFAEAGCDLLADLGRMEDVLDRRELHPRLRARLRSRMLEAIEILEYRPAYKRHFRALNESWLNEHFGVEPADAEILADPLGAIVKPGGAVLFARLDGRIAGTCALERHPGGIFELSKMAVAEDLRRRLVGTRLTLAVAERASRLGAAELYLETHPRFHAARRLYAGLGFELIENSPVPAKYARRRIAMRLDLSKPMPDGLS